MAADERSLRYAYEPGWEARMYNRLRDLVAEIFAETDNAEFVLAAVADGLDDAEESDTVADLDALMAEFEGADDDG